MHSSLLADFVTQEIDEIFLLLRELTTVWLLFYEILVQYDVSERLVHKFLL